MEHEEDGGEGRGGGVPQDLEQVQYTVHTLQYTQGSRKKNEFRGHVRTAGLILCTLKSGKSL